MSHKLPNFTDKTGVWLAFDPKKNILSVASSRIDQAILAARDIRVAGLEQIQSMIKVEAKKLTKALERKLK